MSVRPRVPITRDEFAALSAPGPLEFRDLTGWDYDRILRLIREGQLLAIKVGRHHVINKRAAFALLDGERIEDAAS